MSLGGAVDYFGIRFRPGAVALMFSLPLKALANRMVTVGDIDTHIFREVEARLFETPRPVDRVGIAETFLKERISQIREIDPRFEAVLAETMASRGGLSVEHQTVAGISPRQLRRVFDHYVGISPKVFFRVVRFQYLLTEMMRTPRNMWGRLRFDFGYYDQSHFIKEFKALYGLPPMAAFRQK